MADEGLYSIAPGETPQAVSSRRKLAEALMTQGMQTTPIQHWTQGAARLVQALMGGYGMHQADEEDAAGVQKAMKMYSAGMGMGGDSAQPSAPSISPNASLAPDVPLPPKPLRDIPLDTMRPPQDALRAALASPAAGPSMTAPIGWSRAQHDAAAAGQSSPTVPTPARSPDPRLVASLVNSYLPKPLQELGVARAKEQMKAPEYTHFTAGDKNFVFDKSDPSNVRNLGPSSENKFSNVAEMRKEIHTLPSYKNWTQAEPIYRSMLETEKTDSKASDLNLVYGLGKIMDPTSVVREGEMVMVRNTASLPDWLIGSINSLNGGARLTPDTRKAILAEARSRSQQYYDMVQQDIAPYHGIARNFGMRSEDIIPPIRTLPGIPGQAAAPRTPTAAPAAPIRPAPPGIDPKLWAALTPQEQALWK